MFMLLYSEYPTSNNSNTQPLVKNEEVAVDLYMDCAPAPTGTNADTHSTRMHPQAPCQVREARDTLGGTDSRHTTGRSAAVPVSLPAPHLNTGPHKGRVCPGSRFWGVTAQGWATPLVGRLASQETERARGSHLVQLRPGDPRTAPTVHFLRTTAGPSLRLSTTSPRLWDFSAARVQELHPAQATAAAAGLEVGEGVDDKGFRGSSCEQWKPQVLAVGWLRRWMHPVHLHRDEARVHTQPHTRQL